MELCHFTLIGTNLHPRRGWVSRSGISGYLGYGYYPVATEQVAGQNPFPLCQSRFAASLVVSWEVCECRLNVARPPAGVLIGGEIFSH